MRTADAKHIVEQSARRYFEGRRTRVDAFVDRHFSITGSLALHVNALGWDVIKAPANLVLGIPYAGLQVSGMAARLCGAVRLARFLQSRHVLFETAVARKIEWLVMTELLELPFRQSDRVSTKDALMETILAQDAVQAELRTTLHAVARRGADPAFRERLRQNLTRYTETRSAVAEIATTLMTLGAGAAALQQLTPGALVLGPALAGTMAQQAAVASFPLGPMLGAVWYGAFPVAATPTLVAAMTGGVAGAGAICAAFAGVVTDPLQRVTGLHRRRLLRLIDTVERQFGAHDGADFVARDHYVARLLGLVDLVAGVYRATK